MKTTMITIIKGVMKTERQKEMLLAYHPHFADVAEIYWAVFARRRAAVMTKEDFLRMNVILQRSLLLGRSENDIRSSALNDWNGYHKDAGDGMNKEQLKVFLLSFAMSWVAAPDITLVCTFLLAIILMTTFRFGLLMLEDILVNAKRLRLVQAMATLASDRVMKPKSNTIELFALSQVIPGTLREKRGHIARNLHQLFPERRDDVEELLSKLTSLPEVNLRLSKHTAQRPRRRSLAKTVERDQNSSLLEESSINQTIDKYSFIDMVREEKPKPPIYRRRVDPIRQYLADSPVTQLMGESKVLKLGEYIAKVRSESLRSKYNRSPREEKVKKARHLFQDEDEVHRVAELDSTKEFNFRMKTLADKFNEKHASPFVKYGRLSPKFRSRRHEVGGVISDVERYRFFQNLSRQSRGLSAAESPPPLSPSPQQMATYTSVFLKEKF
eukprot:TRINITY_DN2605_c0_g1_i4.p1 TRINITY_DN2605_c0_g1~~TRINITY_DN2605_c0_g1_i4.p1  ORF type:complete len:441 (+),score=80.68 TRINITY_DN2605_c0_g1_i4:1029-2351(+)